MSTDNEILHEINDGIDAVAGLLQASAKGHPPEVKVSVAAPNVSVAAPTVHVAAPPPAAITVQGPPPVRKWTCEIIERDRDSRIRKFTITAS
jgi:hypothetical protein